MEGLKRLDERQTQLLDATSETSLVGRFSDFLDVDAGEFHKTPVQHMENIIMANLDKTLEEVMKINGAIAAALVDWESGLTLGTIGTGFNIDLAAAGNTDVVKAKLAVMKDLKLKGTVEDILITLTEQYHLIRLLEDSPNLFLYLALDRTQANLGLARHHLSSLEKELSV